MARVRRYNNASVGGGLRSAATRYKDNFAYSVGILSSLVLHLLGFVITLVVLESSAATAARLPQVFSVTLEGGEKLGGISQVPKEDPGKKRVLPHVPVKSDDKSSEKVEEKKAEKKLETPSVVEDPEKILEEKRKAEEQKKLAEKKLRDQKKKEEEKRKAEEQKKKQQEEAKKQAQEKAERKKRLEQALNTAKGKEYKGESAAAGGQGFGAAALGGKGMGGGTLASLEFIAYRNELEKHIKGGWHWLAGNQVLEAQIVIRLLPSGVIQEAIITKKSGNASFDDSVLRAVHKASPVPPPPSKIYDSFREVVITFNSHK